MPYVQGQAFTVSVGELGVHPPCKQTADCRENLVWERDQPHVPHPLQNDAPDHDLIDPKGHWAATPVVDHGRQKQTKPCVCVCPGDTEDTKGTVVVREEQNGRVMDQGWRDSLCHGIVVAVEKIK